jgi:hypothetical protein
LFISKKASDKRTLVGKCAEIEKHIAATGKKILATKEIVKTDKLAADVLDELRKLEPGRFFKIAADQGIILSVDNFCSYLFADRVKTAAVEGIKLHLKDAFSLAKTATEIVNNEKYDPSFLAMTSPEERNTVKKVAMSHSLLPAYVNARLLTSLSKNVEKVAAEDSVFSKELAKQYIAYKLAALNYLEENNRLTDELLFNAVLQNIN